MYLNRRKERIKTHQPFHNWTSHSNSNFSRTSTHRSKYKQARRLFCNPPRILYNPASGNNSHRILCRRLQGPLSRRSCNSPLLRNSTCRVRCLGQGIILFFFFFFQFKLKYKEKTVMRIALCTTIDPTHCEVSIFIFEACSHTILF